MKKVNEIIWLKSIEKHRHLDKLKRMIPIALNYFPELDLVYIGILRKNRFSFANADVDNNLINFKVNEEPKFVTIFHELMHLVQHSLNAPKTEEFCSIHAMARMPKELVDKDIPYIGGDYKKQDLVGICREAVKFRENGNRNYIQYVRNKLFEKPDSNNQKLISRNSGFLGFYSFNDSR